MPHWIADFFLFFTHFIFIIPVILIGFIWINRPFFYQFMCLLLLDMVVNVALKGVFKIPLSPLLHKIGYAFPSGHMQLATVFWGWLFLHWRFLSYRISTLFFLIGIGASLIHYDYHDMADVCMGFVSGLGLIGLYYMMLKGSKKRSLWLITVFATCCMVYNVYAYAAMGVPQHAMISYGVLMLLLWVESFVMRKKDLKR